VAKRKNRKIVKYRKPFHLNIGVIVFVLIFLYVMYNKGSSLYIPLEQISSIMKYASKDVEGVKLHEIGSTAWARTKARVRKRVHDISQDLIKLYAARQNAKGFEFLEDTEENILGIVACAAKAGVRFIYPAFGMTLRQNQREYYLDKLEEIFPGKGLAAKYQRHFGLAYECTSPLAGKLWKTFSTACNQAGILCRMPDIIRAIHLGYGEEQLKFF